MSALHTSLQDVLESGPAALERFAHSIDPQWIEDALQATGTASIRRRKIPADHAVWLVIGMGLFANHPITSIVAQLDLMLPGVESLARSAVTQARYRLGAPPLAWLFGRTAQAWTAHATAALPDYHGLRLFAVDGTSLRVADSDENFAHFGKPGGRGGTGDAGYPQVRLACLLDVTSRLIVDAHFGPHATSEQELTRPFWSAVPDHSLTLLDRGYVDYKALAELTTQGTARHVLVRLRQNTRTRELKELPDGSLLVALPAPRGLGNKHPQVPAELLGRLVAYKHPDGEPGRVFTTLVDHEGFPAGELIRLYHERWEIELAYDELKTHMLERAESLRSRLPEGVAQEIWGLLLAYNLVRREMVMAAVARKLPTHRISFRYAILSIQQLLWFAATTPSPGTIPKHIKDLPDKLRELLLPERRSERRYPRHVKIKMSNYKRNRGKPRTSGHNEVKA